jgi:hypothetical protein
VKFAAGTRDSITGRPYFYRSECGFYTVTIPGNEAVRGVNYGAWGRERDRRGVLKWVSLAAHPNARLAKEACEKHAKEHALERAA